MNEPFSRVGVGYTPGSGVGGKIYQDLSFLGFEHPAHRGGVPQRVAQIVSRYNVVGKRGIDLTCSVGGITMGLAREGAEMVGVDLDREAIDVATYVSREVGLGGSTLFFHMDLADSGLFALMDNEGPFDFGLWYSSWMWVVREYGPDAAMSILTGVCERVPALFFETAMGEGDGAAGEYGPANGKEVMGLLVQGGYKHVDRVGVSPGGWSKRSVFLARR